MTTLKDFDQLNAAPESQSQLGGVGNHPQFPQICEPLSPIQQAALSLFDQGFNVMPIPRVGSEHYGKKPPFGRFSSLFSARLLRSSLILLFDGANLAVICGRLSHNLFVLDCDSRYQFNRVRSELAKRRIPAWAVESERGGHYWLLCSQGEVKNCRPAIGLQVVGNRQYIVAPPSVHPTGQIYEWISREGDLPPTVSLEDIDFLPQVKLQSPRLGTLPHIAHRILVEGEISDYPSHSEAELAAARSLAMRGFQEDEIVAIFEEFQPPHFRSKRNPVDWFHRHMLPTALKGTTHAYPLDRLTRWASDRAWPGRTGETDRRVFLALCERSRMDGRAIFRASQREVAELANVERKTVRRALHRLIEEYRYLSPEGSDPVSGAFLYSFTDNICRSPS